MTTPPAIRTVGVIGAGRMGQPIIGHLVRKGFGVVVHDIDQRKREAVVKLCRMGHRPSRSRAKLRGDPCLRRFRSADA
jgi:3-hydroxyisobutyrate dehydrogenase-like beta-hydroxyacid dehydrogenase